MREPSDSETSIVVTKVGELRVECCGNGPPIFCWPSLYCDARTLDPLVSDLKRDYRVLVVEGPGHGGSGASPGQFSLADCADAAMEILDAMNVPSATWPRCGLGWAHRHCRGAAPSKSNRWPRDPECAYGCLERSAVSAHAIVLRTPLDFWSAFLRRFDDCRQNDYGIIGPRAICPRRRARCSLAPMRQARLLLAARSAMFERGDLIPVLPDVRVRTLFFTGAEDLLFPVKEARAQAAAIPDCRFVVVRRSSHQSALEAPLQVLPVLRETLTKWLYANHQRRASEPTAA